MANHKIPANDVDWTKAADDVHSHLTSHERTYDLGEMLSFVDDVAVLGLVDRDALVKKYGKSDFVDTTLGHVTTAVHGGGKVPKDGGWYSVGEPGHTYSVHPKFAQAWRQKRGLAKD